MDGATTFLTAQHSTALVYQLDALQLIVHTSHMLVGQSSSADQVTQG